MNNLKSKGIGAFFWDFFGKLARHGTSFLVTIVLARLLQPSDFGLIAMVMVIVGVAFIFTDVGLGSAIIQRRRLLPIHYHSVFYFNVVNGGILTLITFFSAEWISMFYNNPQLIPIIEVISLLFAINAFSSLQINILRRELNYASLAKSEVSAAVLSGIIGIMLAFYGVGVWSLVAQVLSRSVFFNIFVWSASRWVPSLLFSFKALKQLWGFGFRMFLAGLLEVIFTRLDIVIIGKLFTPTILGFYDQSKRLYSMVIQYSSGSIMSVLFPVLSKVQNDLIKFQNIAVKTFGIICFIIFFLLGVMYLISEELIVILFSEKWLQSVHYFQILLLSGFAYPVSALLVNILKSRGNSKIFLKLEIYKKILLSINLCVGFLWGIEGYLYGLIIMYAFGVFLNIFFASHEIKLSPLVFLKPLITQMMISIISVWIVMFFIKEIETYDIILISIKSIFFTFVYFTINKLFKTSSLVHTLNQVVPLFK